MALLSLNQIERRTPAAAFGIEGSNPCKWPAVKASIAGDQAPPPLLDSGCCHLDVDALPGNPAKSSGLLFRTPERRPRQVGLGKLLEHVQFASAACGYDGKKASGRKSGDIAAPSSSTGEPSEASCNYATPVTGTSGDAASEFAEWDASPAARTEASPSAGREPSIASSLVSFCYPGALGASKTHLRLPAPAKRSKPDGMIVKVTWADPGGTADQGRARGNTATVSPEGLILQAVPSSDLAGELPAVAPSAAISASRGAPPPHQWNA